LFNCSHDSLDPEAIDKITTFSRHIGALVAVIVGEGYL
jgi:hypothetical protein